MKLVVEYIDNGGSLDWITCDEFESKKELLEAFYKKKPWIKEIGNKVIVMTIDEWFEVNEGRFK